MAKQYEVTIYEGIGKDSKKPFKALRVEVGKFSKLYFLDEINMLYLESKLEKYSPRTPSVESQIDEDSDFLNED